MGLSAVCGYNPVPLKEVRFGRGTSLAGSATPINMQTVITVELKSTAIGF